jgi:hypothetical protein
MDAHQLTDDEFEELERVGQITLNPELRAILQKICGCYFATWAHADQPTYQGVSL